RFSYWGNLPKMEPMKGPRFINEIRIDNAGHRAIHILGKQGGEPFDYHLDIPGDEDIESQLVAFETMLLRRVDDREARELIDRRTQLHFV
ncbi:MAG: hypothetical protein J0L75_14445, partial [Spirochaetes bacterium]|nr:hypothetical protein [Spirochaetota bacterium]